MKAIICDICNRQIDPASDYTRVCSWGKLKSGRWVKGRRIDVCEDCGKAYCRWASERKVCIT